MSWTIEKDHFDGDSDGVSGYGETVTRETSNRKRFYLKDDDGNLMASGWLVEDNLCPHFEDAWESAYEFGAYNWGCTNILDGRRRSVIS